MPPVDVTATSATAAVQLRPPPAALMRLVNPVMRRVIRSRIGRRMEPLAVLRFVGRRTGKRRDIPAGLHTLDGVGCVFTDRPWRHNFSGGIPVTVISGGRSRAGRADLVEDRQRVGDALARAVEQVGARKLGLVIAKGCTPTPADFAAVGKSMIEIHFD
jgi:hypothetical protein